MERRDLLIGAAASITTAAFTRIAGAQSSSTQALPLDRAAPASIGADKLARISIMTYNFTSRLKLEGQPLSPDRVLDLFDIPQYFADTYGVHNVEVQHSHFASVETAYLKDFRAHIEKTKSHLTQINVEFGQMTATSSDPVQRYQAIDLTQRWVDHASVLNCPRIMINQGRLTPESKATAISSIKLMSEYAKSKGVKITCETREERQAIPASVASATTSPLPALSSGDLPAWPLVNEVVDATGAFSNVDIGNIMAPDQATLHTVIKTLFHSSSGNMHIKVSPNWDLGTAIRYTNTDLGYKGLFSIEVSPHLIRSVYDTILANI